MNRLFVRSLPADFNRVKVLWAAGESRKGAVEVHFEGHVPDIEAAAELAAARHLLTRRMVTGNPVFTGRGIHLHVTKGVIRKLALGRSEKKHLRKYASFLSTRLSGAKITTEKKADLLPNDEIAVDEVISASATAYESAETVVGTVFITDHALMRFKERVFEGREDRAFGSLVDRLGNPELRPGRLSEKAEKGKESRYGPEDKRIILRHPTDIVHYVIVVDSAGNKLLVTVYDRNEDRIPLQEISEQEEAQGVAQSEACTA